MGGLKNVTPDSGGDVMTSSNMTDNNVTYSWADLVAANDEMALTVIPVMVLLAVMMVLGVFGNTLVCYIFCFRLRPSTQNYLIVYLAVFDLISSTLAMPTGIVFMRHMLTFEWDIACRIMKFINMFSAIGSIFTLVVIAVDRFRKVCRPLKGQLSIKHIKYSLIPITGIAIFYAWPTLFLYGLRPKESGIPGLPGKDCSTSVAVQGTPFPLIYNVFLFTSFGVLTTSLMIIYCRVLSETKRHTRYMKENPEAQPTKPVHHEDSSNDHSANPHSATLTTETSHTTDEIVHTTSETPQTCTGSDPKPKIFINMAASGLSDTHLLTKSPEKTSEPPLKETELEVFAGEAPILKGDNCVQTERVNSLQSENSPTQTDTSLRPSPPTQTDTSPPESQLCEVPLFHSETIDHVTSHLPSAGPNDGGNDVTKTSDNPTSSTSNPGVFSVTPKTTPPCEKTKDNKKSRAQRFESKTTKIAFLITLVFVLSFLPHLCLQASKRIYKEYDAKLHGAGLVFYHIFFRSYFLNSISNPFIYGALNAKFKEEVKKLFRRVRAFCKRK